MWGDAGGAEGEVREVGSRVWGVKLMCLECEMSGTFGSVTYWGGLIFEALLFFTLTFLSLC